MSPELIKTIEMVRSLFILNEALMASTYEANNNPDASSDNTTQSITDPNHIEIR